MTGARQPRERGAPAPSAATPPRWLRRLSLLTFVMFCLWIGVLLVALPWTRVWTDNALLTGSPALRAVSQNPALRGAVSGLGFLDIFLGVWEALHYREGH